MFPIPSDQDELSWEKLSVEGQPVGEELAAGKAVQHTCRGETATYDPNNPGKYRLNQHDEDVKK